MTRLALAGGCALLIAAATAAPVAAQCAPGRTRGPETAGRCCWPGQRWSDERRRCEGPPSCPPGRAAHGDACVFVEEAPRTAHPGPPLRFREEPAPHDGVIASGLIGFGAAYVYSVIAGLAYLDRGTARSGMPIPSSSWTSLIPLVGGYLWAGLDETYDRSLEVRPGEVFGVPAAALQLVGLAVVVVGLLGWTRRVRVEDVELGLPGSPARF